LTASIALGVGLSDAGATPRSAPLISAQGVAKIHLGYTAASLESRLEIGPLRRSALGCEPSSGKRVAKLHMAGVKGVAVFSTTAERLIGLEIVGGEAETARHVRIGTPTGKALHAYPDAIYDPGGVTPDGIIPGMIWVNSRAHPKMAFEIPAEGGTAVSVIFVPSPRICELAPSE
jgi:hypothetical protein